MNQPESGDSDTIQLFEDAVQHLLPAYVDEDAMYEALDRCGMTQREIFDELDRRCGEAVATMSEHELAHQVRTILFDSFNDALEAVSAHKAPLYDD